MGCSTFQKIIKINKHQNNGCKINHKYFTLFKIISWKVPQLDYTIEPSKFD